MKAIRSLLTPWCVYLLENGELVAPIAQAGTKKKAEQLMDDLELFEFNGYTMEVHKYGWKQPT